MATTLDMDTPRISMTLMTRITYSRILTSFFRMSLTVLSSFVFSMALPAALFRALMTK